MRTLTTWLLTIALAVAAATAAAGCGRSDDDPSDATRTGGNHGTSAGQPGPGQ